MAKLNVGQSNGTHGLGLSDFSVFPKAQIKVLGTPLPACQIQNAK
jgi:hypothetical protein